MNDNRDKIFNFKPQSSYTFPMLLINVFQSKSLVSYGIILSPNNIYESYIIPKKRFNTFSLLNF